jgi:crotonobetainyl-CoA:carnitine CoA-transferase CaiB-like acyl-CoA transferase
MLGKAITAALFAREKIGVGQRIDTSLLEAEVASLINVGSNYLVGGKVPTRWGNAHPNIVPYQNFKTADGYLVIGVASEVIWKRFCQAIGRPDLTDDRRFADNSKRVENRAELISLLSELFLKRNNEAWFKGLTDAEVPCAPVQSIDQVFQAPQVLHRDMLVEVEHPTAGKVRMAGMPVKFSLTPASVRMPPPLLGEHNSEILKNWLGMNAEAIEELKREKII